MQKRPHLARSLSEAAADKTTDSGGSSLSSFSHKLSQRDRNGKMKREESEGGETAQNIPKTTTTTTRLCFEGGLPYMTFTRFCDFSTPPPLCPQNLYCLSANLGYFLSPTFPCSDVIYGSSLEHALLARNFYGRCTMGCFDSGETLAKFRCSRPLCISPSRLAKCFFAGSGKKSKVSRFSGCILIFENQ